MGIFIRNNLPNNLDPQEKTQGWRLLWDGKSGKGWRSAAAQKFPDDPDVDPGKRAVIQTLSLLLPLDNFL